MLRHCRNLRGKEFHYLAKLRTELLEVGFHLLHEHALVIAHKLDFLHVDLVLDKRAHCLYAVFLRLAHHRHHDHCQRLTHFQVGLAAQSEHHRRDVLSHLHLLLKRLVDYAFVGNREVGQVNRCRLAGSSGGQVGVQTVGKERRYGSNQQSHRLQTCEQSLISRQFVVVHLAAPETLAVEAHIPVAQVVAHEIRDGACSLCRLIVVEVGRHFLNQRVEQRYDPAVDFRAFLHRNLFRGIVKSVDVGIKSEE